MKSLIGKTLAHPHKCAINKSISIMLCIHSSSPIFGDTLKFAQKIKVNSYPWVGEFQKHFQAKIIHITHYH